MTQDDSNTSRPTTLWLSDTELHPTFQALNHCLTEDWFLLPYEIRLQRAHVAALLDANIITPDDAARINHALDDIQCEQRVDCQAGTVKAPPPDSDIEDLHTWIESEVIARAGDPGKKLHTARSRNDQVATLIRLFLIQAGNEFIDLTAQCAKSCATRAKDWADLIFPLQTHCQFAAPGSVGFWSLRYATAFHRAAETMSVLSSLWQSQCPLGSAAVAGSSIPINRDIQAAQLNFAAPSLNALDTTSTRDDALQYLAVSAQLALTLQSFATDIIAFTQTPFAWTRYPKPFGTGSSMMPNKANPDAMELLRGAACELQSAHGQLLLIMKGLPSGYNRDLQCVKPIIHRAAIAVRQLCELTAAFIDNLDFDPEKLATSLTKGNIGATLRMEHNVKSGKPLREAHHDEAASTDFTTDHFATAAHLYATSASASPSETRRIADHFIHLLTKITAPPKSL